jgi:protein-S-isoprenylcysteine O-methyltransferase Ste14
LLGCEISRSRHSRTRPKAHHRDRPHGPYRFSRNPIYLAFSLFQLGIAIWVNSAWLLATLVGAVALIHSVVIPKEEQYLEGKFGEQYLDYKASVRRWL